MTKRSRVAFGLIAAVGAFLPMGVFATSASAASGTSIQINQNALIAATTCYTFVGAEDEDYCNEGLPMHASRTVALPPKATEVVIDLKIAHSGEWKDSIAVDASKNHCIAVGGTLFDAWLKETDC
ncbi:hypothetical protein [Streptomyces sp. Isolate_219]|uniref:hypothetical protein n=1 Tax=Streptomyces sp. Isolate_219 TaxID=2950110 RepID=UPI0021C6DECC|nr:hypothetical protein [Streptomyces sp. Isolate_219]MCR8579691.1 hypothetical protein [Streptomyces sp. Isolate_219]